jgi:hypothetical protein
VGLASGKLLVYPRKVGISPRKNVVDPKKSHGNVVHSCLKLISLCSHGILP